MVQPDGSSLCCRAATRHQSNVRARGPRRQLQTVVRPQNLVLRVLEVVAVQLFHGEGALGIHANIEVEHERGKSDPIY